MPIGHWNSKGKEILLDMREPEDLALQTMLLRRHRRRTAQNVTSGKLMLFFGARTKEEWPYFDRLPVEAYWAVRAHKLI